MWYLLVLVQVELHLPSSKGVIWVEPIVHIFRAVSCDILEKIWVELDAILPVLLDGDIDMLVAAA